MRRNAALSLAAFSDPAARPELVAILRPYIIAAPVPGVILLSAAEAWRLRESRHHDCPHWRARGSLSRARRSPLLEKNDGASGAGTGDALATLSADQHHVWEALRALVLVGTKEDLEDVQRYMRPG